MNRIIVLGDLNIDISVVIPAGISKGKEFRTVIRNSAGGVAVNFARTAARAGAHVDLIGCVGDDLLGDALISSLVRHGIGAHVKRAPIPTGTIIALNDGVERTMLCSRGANDGLSASDLDSGLFDGANHLHISGYAILSPHQAGVAKKAAEIAKDAGLSISLSSPPANLISQFGTERFLAAIMFVDWLFLNLAEGRVLTGVVTPAGIADFLAARFPVGAVTLGAEGSLAWAGPARSRAKTEPVAGVDTTGAGDAFTAGFVVSYLNHHDIMRANQYAVAVSHSLLQSQLPLV